MLQPDAVFQFKIGEPVHSIQFLNQSLIVGCASGKIKVYCLSVSRSLKKQFKIFTSSNDCQSLIYD